MNRPSPILMLVGTLAVASQIVASQLVAPAATAAPPAPPSLSTITAELDAIPTSAETSSSGYSRDLFPHWSTQSGSCNTREVVLKRDGTDVVTNSSCASVSGTWYSEYDGAVNPAASDVDIDHVVALAEAWRSGASTWTTSQRGRFANSLSDGQLIAVTDNVNQAKSDLDAAEWVPPLESYHCTFAKQIVHVKYVWKLSMDTAEKTAITRLLATC